MTGAAQPVQTSYPAHYPVRYALVHDGLPWASAATLAGLGQFAAFAPYAASTVAAFQIAPDGEPVLGYPSPGQDHADARPATYCRASVWIIDEDLTYRAPARFMVAYGQRVNPAEAVGDLTFYDFDLTASDWLTLPDDAVAGRDGFRARCRQWTGHDGPCSNGPFRWDRTTGLVAP